MDNELLQKIKELEETVEILGKDNAGWFRQYKELEKSLAEARLYTISIAETAAKGIKELETQLELKDKWVKHHQESAQLSFNKATDLEKKLTEALAKIKVATK